MGVTLASTAQRVNLAGMLVDSVHNWPRYVPGMGVEANLHFMIFTEAWHHAARSFRCDVLPSRTGGNEGSLDLGAEQCEDFIEVHCLGSPANAFDLGWAEHDQCVLDGCGRFFGLKEGMHRYVSIQDHDEAIEANPVERGEQVSKRDSQDAHGHTSGLTPVEGAQEFFEPTVRVEGCPRASSVGEGEADEVAQTGKARKAFGGGEMFKRELRGPAA